MTGQCRRNHVYNCVVNYPLFIVCNQQFLLIATLNCGLEAHNYQRLPPVPLWRPSSLTFVRMSTHWKHPFIILQVQSEYKTTWHFVCYERKYLFYFQQLNQHRLSPSVSAWRHTDLLENLEDADIECGTCLHAAMGSEHTPLQRSNMLIIFQTSTQTRLTFNHLIQGCLRCCWVQRSNQWP